MWKIKIMERSAIVLLLVFSFAVHGIEISISDQYKLINHELSLFLDAPADMGVEEAFRKYENAEFVENLSGRVSFGFTDSAIWSVLPVTNEHTDTQTRLIRIDNAWLDEIDLYYFISGQLIKHQSLGDTLTFKQRQLDTRMPSISYAFPKGTTYVLLRFRSQDPMTIPIYFGQDKAVTAKILENGYFYGALYGALSILLIYNMVLYFYLRETRYLLYSLYLLAFTLFNITYTGHGFWWLWSQWPFLQQWLMPLLMFCYLFSGVMFTIEFLNARVFLPTLYTSRRKIYCGLLAIAAVLIISGSRSFAVMVQLAILTTLSFWMLLIGFLAYKNGNPLAKFFVPAIALGTGGATVSSLATWGVIPYSQWAFRGIEIGILLEMSLLSISLGFNFKLVQEARKSAETNARLDPLTGLYNRRAFSDLLYPVWELSKRNKTCMTVMLIDLDWFKQINDEHGHAAGDQVLQRVAMELKSRLRASDIALRWGGEEFLVFLPETDLKEATYLAEVLRKHIQSIRVEKRISVTMSVGVASAKPADSSLDNLVKQADEALYMAKQKGRNRVFASGVASSPGLVGQL